MKLKILYVGDTWLSSSSLQLLAVCSSVEKAIELAKLHSENGEEPFEDTDIEEMKLNWQTYGRDENYMICEVGLDELD